MACWRGSGSATTPPPGTPGIRWTSCFDLYSVHWGRPEAVAASLLAEPLLDEVTDLICQLSPGTPTQEQALEALDLLATEVGPAIGWAPANIARAATA